MKKNNGFTLIELIGVITLLSLIVLVSVPVIINTLNKSEQKEYDEFKKILENAAELYLERNRNLYPDFGEIGDTIDITAETLIKEGYLKEHLKNPINDNDVSKYKVAVIYGQDELIDYRVIERKIFAELVTTTDEVTSVNACALSGICQNGTKFAIQVNENDIYNFYVINDDGNEATLIMDRNLGDNIEWINAEDYAIANSEEGDNTVCEYDACNDEGPITALNALIERTSGWINISERDYTYSDDGRGNKYTAFKENVRARLITYTEANAVISANNNIMPSWMYANLKRTGSDTDSLGNDKNGYWTSSTPTNNSGYAHYVDSFGTVNSYYTDISDNGLRPVITVSRSL